eukprot:TRINITY_DN3775_c0_g1_i2.p1 TRINITY_DN3775_c0_g1~~TRINITY_DN3775_c0_g1_i2.p1  ORF type:complete len:814 (-),score=171.57 TRINITY_DN3775_c0_g1_i2:69-2438(-)
MDVSDNSLDLQRRIIALWFGGSLKENLAVWFATNERQVELDAQIRKEFGSTLHSAEKGELVSWTSTIQGHVALIIVLDQFTRHVYRVDSEFENPMQYKTNDSMALKLAHDLLDKGEVDRIPLPWLIFAMMPLRHSRKYDELQVVLDTLQNREEVEIENMALLKRFKNETTRKIYNLQSQRVIDPNTRILEKEPFDADESNIASHPLYKCMDSFLARRFDPSWGYNIVSLSGGVDSMVVLKLLCLLSKKYKFTPIAIHIDYTNRPESGLEADFVEEWSKKCGVIFRKKVMDLQRATADREWYEKETKRLRFETYASVRDEFNTDCGIIFGHHKGDEQENIISNILKGRESILTLSGMAPEGMISGQKIWRPLLPFTKDAIFDIAHKYGIPYFLDTTPDWSNRGKLRNELQPMLEDQFGSSYLDALSNLGRDSAEMHVLVYDSLFKLVWDTIQRSSIAVWMNYGACRSQPRIFWKETLKHLFHSMNESSVKEKTMVHFMKRLSGDTWCNGNGVWVALKKGMGTLLYGDYLVAFRPNVFSSMASSLPADAPTNAVEDIPSDPSRTIFSFPKVVNYPVEVGNSYSFGKWTVTLKEVPLDYRRSDGRVGVNENDASSAGLKEMQVGGVEGAGGRRGNGEKVEGEIDLFDVLSGSFEYLLRDAPGYHVDQASRPKDLHLIPRALTMALPIVAPYPDVHHKDDCKRHILVTTTYTDNDILKREKEISATRGSNYDRAKEIVSMSKGDGPSSSRQARPNFRGNDQKKNQEEKKPKETKEAAEESDSEEFGTGGLFED